MGTSINNPPSVSGYYKFLGVSDSTVNVAAAAVTNHVLILVHTKMTAGGATSGQATIDINVGGVSKQQYPIYQVGTTGPAAISATHHLYYVPSAGEMSAGFAVTITNTPNDAGRTMTTEDILVMGY